MPKRASGSGFWIHILDCDGKGDMPIADNARPPTTATTTTITAIFLLLMLVIILLLMLLAMLRPSSPRLDSRAIIATRKRQKSMIAT